MFLPLFIALLLGSATPSNTTNNFANNSRTVVTSGVESDGNPGNGTGGDTDPVTGETGQIKPPKP